MTFTVVEVRTTELQSRLDIGCDDTNGAVGIEEAFRACVKLVRDYLVDLTASPCHRRFDSF